MYVDKFASLDERITYKKDRKRSAFRMEEYQRRGPTFLWCGHQPTFSAYRCKSLKVEGNTLIFRYQMYREDGSRDDIEKSVDVI